MVFPISILSNAGKSRQQFRRGNVQLTKPINLDDYQQVGELKKMTEAYMASTDGKRSSSGSGVSLLSEPAQLRDHIV